jgi:hypothetical protein
MSELAAPHRRTLGDASAQQRPLVMYQAVGLMDLTGQLSNLSDPVKEVLAVA